jgi:zinc transport system permease protein
MELGFLARAALGALLVSLTLSLLSGFVVLKRLAFAGSGIAHAAFGGVAIALLLRLPAAPVAITFALGLALLVAWLSRDRGLPEDSAIGIFYAASMAVGVVALGFQRHYTVDLFSLLFGNMLALTSADLWTLAALAVVVAIVAWRLFADLISVSFDEDLAAVSGLPVAALNRLLMLLLTLSIVLSMKAVGLVLVSALLVLPGATALEVSRSLRSYVGWTLCFGLLAAGAGLAASFAFNLASGAAIVLSGTAIFLVIALARRRPRRRSSAA